MTNRLWKSMAYLTVFSDNYVLLLMAVAICALIGTIIFLLFKIRVQKRAITMYIAQEEKFGKVIELTEDVFFEYNIQKDIMYHMDRYKQVFGRNNIIYNYTESLVEKAFVHVEDQPVFEEFCNALHIGKSYFSYEFRLLNKRNEYEWCHVNGKSISEDKGLPIRVIGRIINIDAQKTEFDRLQFKAQRDEMTNVYNKNTVREMISETLQKCKKYERHALFVIDIDDFKHVNDTYGHLQGDYVLTSTISNMVSNFREEDIIGRIGGDEFVALMKNVTGREQIFNKAESICKVFNRTFTFNEEVVQVSCSIGIAIYPMDGLTYEELLEHADLALYNVKSDGKNSFMMYCDLGE